MCECICVCVCVHPRHPPDDKGAGTFIIFSAQCSQTTSDASTLAFFIFIEITERECKHQLMNSHLGAHFARIGQTDPFINRGCARRRFGYSGMGSILHFVSLTFLRWRKRKKKKKKKLGERPTECQESEQCARKGKQALRIACQAGMISILHFSLLLLLPSFWLLVFRFGLFYFVYFKGMCLKVCIN